MIFYFPGLLSEEGHTLPMARFYATFPACLYIFQVVMIYPDFEYDHTGLSKHIYSYHKITAEVLEFCLFWKLSKNIGFHRN